MFWIVIFLLALTLTGSGLWYLASCLGKTLLSGLSHPLLGGLGLVTGLSAAAAALWGMWNTVVILLHLILFRLFCGAVCRLTGCAGTLLPNGAALLLTAAYLLYARYTCCTVRETDYSLSSGGKLTEPLRIVGFSDSHLGAVFGGAGLGRYVDELNALTPDAAVVVGDFIDDATSREDMERGCAELGRLKTKWGVFYVPGNHDRGYYASKRGYGEEALFAELEKNGVRVLRDETVTLPNGAVLVGRLDKSYDRAPVAALTEGTEGLYRVVLDHQPSDYAAEAAAGVELVLSGHTHGGQLIPIRKVGEWLHMNDRTYGHERRASTDFIVSSGIADWELSFKSGCISEYFVIDIR